MSRTKNALDQITDSTLRAIHQENAYKMIKPTLDQTKTFNPYAQNPDAADLLEDLGIVTHPLAIRAHTHAAAKAIELDMYKTVGHYLPKENPVTFLFMKRGKLNYFSRGPQQGDIFISSIVEPRDFARYELDDIFRMSNGFCVPTSVAFMGDTLHYFTFSDLVNIFNRSPNLQNLYATLVLPPEAAHRIKSLYPSVYEIDYYPKHFMYKPGGHAGGAYCHTYEQLEWLKVGAIKWSDARGRTHTITAQLIETKAANHLFIFSRGCLKTPEMRSFQTAEQYVTLPSVFLPKKYNARQPISKTLALQIFMYMKSVKAASQRDVWAKIRQLLRTKELNRCS